MTAGVVGAPFAGLGKGHSGVHPQRQRLALVQVAVIHPPVLVAFLDQQVHATTIGVFFACWLAAPLCLPHERVCQCHAHPSC